MASKFEILTKYIQQMKDDKFGDWIIDRENDGTPERPIHLPFVNYSETVESFLHDVSQFMEDNKDFDLYRYREILEDNGIEWGSVSMSEADVSSLNAQSSWLSLWERFGQSGSVMVPCLNFFRMAVFLNGLMFLVQALMSLLS